MVYIVAKHKKREKEEKGGDVKNGISSEVDDEADL